MCQMEALQNRIKHYLPDVEEWKVTRRNGVSFIINAYSLDQFGFYFMDSCEKKINAILFGRQQYTLPNTPKILIFPLTSTQQHLMPNLILAQHAPYTFQKLIAHHSAENTISDLFFHFLKIVEMLSKKYGYFKITSKMIKAIKGPTPMIWINQNVFDNRRQFPLLELQSKKCEEIMVRNLLDLVLARCQNSKLSSISSQQSSLTFQITSSLLRRMKKVEKMKCCTETKKFQKKSYKMPIFLGTMKKKKDEKGIISPTKRVQKLSLYDATREENRSSKKTITYPAENTQISSSFGSSQYFDCISSLKTPKTQASQASPTNRTNFEKNFRDTRNTLSITTNRLSSVNTSLNKNSDGISSSFGFRNNSRALMSSFGTSHKEVHSSSKREYKNSCKFFVKESKIIEQNSEEFCLQSPSLLSPQGNGLFYNQSSSLFEPKDSSCNREKESVIKEKDSLIKVKNSMSKAKDSFIGEREEIQKDFSCLFHSPHQQTLQADIPVMEEELNRLLLQ